MHLSVVFCMVCLSGPPQSVSSYTVDPLHSAALYKIKESGISWAYGRLGSVKGNMVVAEKTLSRLSLEWASAGINSGNEERDRVWTGPGYFDVAAHPRIVFNSTAIESVGTGKFNVTGKLTIRGVSKTINFILSKTGETDSARHDHRMGYEGYPVFKRSDFGMKSGENQWGDEMMLIISLQAVRTG